MSDDVMTPCLKGAELRAQGTGHRAKTTKAVTLSIVPLMVNQFFNLSQKILNLIHKW